MHSFLPAGLVPFGLAAVFQPGVDQRILVGQEGTQVVSHLHELGVQRQVLLLSGLVQPLLLGLHLPPPLLLLLQFQHPVLNELLVVLLLLLQVFFLVPVYLSESNGQVFVLGVVGVGVPLLEELHAVLLFLLLLLETEHVGLTLGLVLLHSGEYLVLQPVHVLGLDALGEFVGEAELAVLALNAVEGLLVVLEFALGPVGVFLVHLFQHVDPLFEVLLHLHHPSVLVLGLLHYTLFTTPVLVSSALL